MAVSKDGETPLHVVPGGYGESQICQAHDRGCGRGVDRAGSDCAGDAYRDGMERWATSVMAARDCNASRLRS